MTTCKKRLVRLLAKDARKEEGRQGRRPGKATVRAVANMGSRRHGKSYQKTQQEEVSRKDLIHRHHSTTGVSRKSRRATQKEWPSLGIGNAPGGTGK